MKNKLKWFFWRITSYYMLSDYMHADAIGVLTLRGIEKMNKMKEEERKLWYLKTFGNYFKKE